MPPRVEEHEGRMGCPGLMSMTVAWGSGLVGSIQAWYLPMGLRAGGFYPSLVPPYGAQGWWVLSKPGTSLWGSGLVGSIQAWYLPHPTDGHEPPGRLR